MNKKRKGNGNRQTRKRGVEATLKGIGKFLKINHSGSRTYFELPISVLQYDEDTTKVNSSRNEIVLRDTRFSRNDQNMVTKENKSKVKKSSTSDKIFDCCSDDECSRTISYTYSKKEVSRSRQQRIFSVDNLEEFNRDENESIDFLGCISNTFERKSSAQGSNGCINKKSRAERANQRRMLKSLNSVHTDSFAVNKLIGNESKLRFSRSKIHGWGVFTNEAFQKDDLICEYRGDIIGNAVADRREIEYRQQKIGSNYMFRIGEDLVCDATYQGSLARFINSSCDPNCYTQIIQSQGKKRIVIYAKRIIKRGEELSYDYKYPLQCDDNEREQCSCGSKDCRGYF